MNQNQNQKPLLEVLTPINNKNLPLPFDQISVEEAFNIWAQPENWNLGLKLLSIDFDLNKVLFTWAFDTQLFSTFILVYTCKGRFFNSNLNQEYIQDLLERAFNDEEINGGGDWDYTFNGVTLVVTIKHIYD